MRTNKGSAVTVGTFDGVHRGHRKILETLVREAEKRNLEPIVVTFPEPPRNFFGDKTKLLCTLEKRKELLKKAGIERVEVIDFKDIHMLSPEEFAKRVLAKRLNCKLFVASSVFVFGNGREGNIGTLRALGKEHGFEVIEVGVDMKEGRKVGSSAIREALAEGDIAKTRELLGYDPTLTGKVIKGKGKGKEMGFPTINIEPDKGLADLKSGIYAAVLAYGGKEYKGAGYIGTKPTFGSNRMGFEIYIMEKPPRIAAGERAEIRLVERIRDDRKFGSEQELSEAIAGDVKEIDTWFKKKFP